MKRDAGQRVGEILREIIDAQVAGQGQMYHRLFSGWDELVGAPLAGRSAILELENRQLVIALDHPASLQLLRMQQRGILKHMQQRFPELNIRAIRGIVLPAGLSRGPPTDVGASGDEGQSGSKGSGIVDEQELGSALTELSAVSDPRLRAALARLYQVATRRDDRHSTDETPGADDR